MLRKNSRFLEHGVIAGGAYGALGCDTRGFFFSLLIFTFLGLCLGVLRRAMIRLLRNSSAATKESLPPYLSARGAFILLYGLFCLPGLKNLYRVFGYREGDPLGPSMLNLLCLILFPTGVLLAEIIRPQSDGVLETGGASRP
jgi:hypothetical protein